MRGQELKDSNFKKGMREEKQKGKEGEGRGQVVGR